VVEDDPALVRFGSVSFYLTREPAADLRGGAGTGRTVKGRDQAGRFPLHLASGDWSLSLGADGAVLTGPDQSATLSAMEGRLLKALLERAAEATYTPSAVLVGSVGFGSRSADGDNVRELVARVRRKLAKVGLKGLIESKPRTGYRLAPAMLRQP
jgi:DNA-binding response OmpR family regulator